MKLFKVIATAVALGLASASVAQAQEKKGRGNMSPEQRIEQIEQAVGSLSADQKSKITAIYAKLAENMKGGDREKMGEMTQAARKDVRAVLTPEQQKKFDDMPQRGGGGGGKKKN